jgi:c(7)-type cytochrome triheme protein
MRNGWIRKTLALAAGVAVVATSVVLAEGLPKLPKDFVFPQTGDSPGKVTFSHASHVDAARPVCTSCHPSLFRILKPGAPVEGAAITHDAMGKGRQCGACHDGKKAFGFDDCTVCHRAS